MLTEAVAGDGLAHGAPGIEAWETGCVSRLVLAWPVLLLLLATGAACGDDREAEAVDDRAAAIRVASFDFAESALLAELYAQALESGGLPVIRLGSIGPREIIAPAQELDLIDVVPEYLGTALQYAGVPEPNPDPVAARELLNDRLLGRGLTALEPSPAEDKNVIVVTRDTAEANDLAIISDLSPLAERQRFGGPAECPDRPLCLVGLDAVYGLRFAEFVPQRSLAFTAEALRRGEIDVGLMFSTASELEADDLVELADDRRMQPAENVVPVVRLDALERWGPALADSLDRVSVHLTTADLRGLNLQVADGEPVEDVAARWLSTRELAGAD